MDVCTLYLVFRLDVGLERKSIPNLTAEECLAKANAFDGAQGWANCSCERDWRQPNRTRDGPLPGRKRI